MSLRSLLFATFTLVFAVASSAQSTCPMKQAKHVGEHVEIHSKLPCSGTTISAAGVTIVLAGSECPLFATHTPQHEIEVDATTKTMVQLVGQAKSMVYHFECSQDWYLIVPWGSSCRLAKSTVGATLLRYITIPCPVTITP